MAMVNSSDAKFRVNGPAIGLYIVAGLSFLIHAMQLVFSLKNGPFFPNADFSAYEGGYFCGLLIGLVSDMVIICGADSLRNLTNYRTARMGALLAIIPFLSPCILLGIPFGIWALRVLDNKDVQGAFDKESKEVVEDWPGYKDS